MKSAIVIALLVAGMFASCESRPDHEDASEGKQDERSIQEKEKEARATDVEKRKVELREASLALSQIAPVASAEQEKEIRNLIEQLVFAPNKAKRGPLIHPDFHGGEEYRERYESCRRAFKRLSEFRGIAFPFMVEHLNDERQSIPFRNHYTGYSVGNACYWNLYFQLQDRPSGYSSYGLSRRGRDGEYHTKPYWQGTPFDDSGGLVKWLVENVELSYAEKQIKCLNWLLEKEKAIGASDPASYFLNILPLEIQVLERKLETTQFNAKKLERLKTILSEKKVSEVPHDLLPDEADQVDAGQSTADGDSKSE